MLHRNTLIAICAIFCAIAVGAGLFVANMSKQSGLIAQQSDAGVTSLPTAAASPEPTPIADLPSVAGEGVPPARHRAAPGPNPPQCPELPGVAGEPVPTSAPIAVLDPAAPTAASQPA